MSDQTTNDMTEAPSGSGLGGLPCSLFSVGDIVTVPIKNRWGIDCAATIEAVHADTVDATVWNMDGPGANRLVTGIPHSVCEANKDINGKGMDKMMIYIAGPMSWFKDFNKHAFYNAQFKLESMGYSVVNPVQYEEEVLKINLDSENGDPSKIKDFDISETLLRDIEMLSSCDAIFMLHGWEFSKGARAEHAFAIATGKVIHYQDAP